MSYILDALRRADLERERGAVPGLNAQPAALPGFDAEASSSARPWVWALVGALVVLLAALAWVAFGRGTPAPPALAAANPAAPPAVAASQTPPVAALAPSTSTSTAESSGVVAPTSRAPAPAPAPAVAQPPAARPAATHTARAPASPPERHATAPRNSSRAPERVDRATAAGKRPETPRVPATDPDDGAGGGLIYTRDQLPASIRSELPDLSIGGASYSKNPASRMLIINGQVFHEGDSLGPDLTLKQIQLKAAVLEYKGYRYKVSF